MSSLLMPMYNIFSSFKNKLFLLTCGGSIHDHNFIEKFKSINIDVCPAYAATEFNVLSILLPDDNIKFSISSGILVSNDVKIEIDNNGLILAKSESMMLGYIGDKGELMNPLNNG
jgi:long-subunit acyl-CoA synthetase (AMP-forming)